MKMMIAIFLCVCFFIFPCFVYGADFGEDAASGANAKKHVLSISGLAAYMPQYKFVGGVTLDYKYIYSANEEQGSPKIIFGLRNSINTTAYRAEAEIRFKPARQFALFISPFYTSGWRYYEFENSSEENQSIVKDKTKENAVSIHSTFGYKLGNALYLYPLVIENTLTFHHFKTRVYDMMSGLIVKNEPIENLRAFIVFPLSMKYLIFAYTGISYSVEIGFHSYRFQAIGGFTFGRIAKRLSLIVPFSITIVSSESKVSFGIFPHLRYVF